MDETHKANTLIQTTKLPEQTEIKTNFPTQITPITTKIIAPAHLESVKYEVISPLDKINKKELREIISNPFQEPTPGQDDGHHGVDFAFYSFKKFKSIDDHLIVSILPGTVSAVINDRPPYGNAIIIETSLELLSDKTRMMIDSLAIDNKIYTTSNLLCPSLINTQFQFQETKDSLYVLYSHMKFVPAFELFDDIEQGKAIGNVGNTGNSGNSHLHLEIRIGPAHATFPEMAHYINSATDNEMAYYCLWRVSNYFSPFDPTFLIFE